MYETTSWHLYAYLYILAGGQGTFNAPVNRGNLRGNHQQSFDSAQGSQVQGGVKAKTITGFNGK